MNFSSDNVSGAAPEILRALEAANTGAVPSYGADPWTERVEARLAEIFETEVTAFPVATGTAANALALSVLAPPYGAVYCHEAAHVMTDECGAPELYTGGAKLVGLPGPHGRIAPATLEEALSRAGAGVVHHVQPAALSLTQATESGTVYRPAEIAALADLAHAHGLAVHIDGARFANALAFLGCTPAEATWKVGVDVLSLGATKNGALAAEAVIFFGRTAAAGFGYRRKRAGHLFSKMRFLSAQLDAYLTDGLWLRLAAHANAMAARLAEGLAALPGAALQAPVEANEIFIALPDAVIEGLFAEGFQFYRWDGPVVRLVTAWNSRAEDIDALTAAARRLSGRHGGRPGI